MLRIGVVCEVVIKCYVVTFELDCMYFFYFILTGITSISLNDIDDIRQGHSSDTFNLLSKKYQGSCPMVDDVNCHQDQCFSIKFKDDTPVLDLVAENKSDRDLLVNVLTHLVATIRSLNDQKEFEM